MNKNQLTFVNHASFHIANETSLLLVDPWAEGTVFNNGWSLLDTSTSNAALVRQLAARRLNTFIWFSHEHPDHFSMSFIKKLKHDFAGKVTMLFQQSRDKRVLTFLQKQGFDVIECASGATIKLDEALAITVFPFADGDSYAVIKSGEKVILNLNDCALTTAAMCEDVKARIAPVARKVDLLFTQFGYANWVGNPFEPGLRRSAAAEKRKCMALQMEAFTPALTIPFASFVSFCSVENCYLNDYQNSAYTIRQWSTLSSTTASVRFMKPGDTLDLNVATPGSMVRMSHAAVEHWEQLGAGTRETLPSEASAAPAEVASAFAGYQAALAAKLPLLPWLLEKLRLVKPLTIFMPDIELTARFSYVSGYTVLPLDTAFHISMTSASTVFLFSTEHGFDTMHINGRFRTASPDALLRFSRFFKPRIMCRQGYGIGRTFATASHLAGNVLGRLRAGA